MPSRLVVILYDLNHRDLLSDQYFLPTVGYVTANSGQLALSKQAIFPVEKCRFISEEGWRAQGLTVQTARVGCE